MSRGKLIKQLELKAKEVDILSDSYGENTEVGQRLVGLNLDIQGAIKGIKDICKDRFTMCLENTELYLSYSDKYERYRITELDDPCKYRTELTDEEIQHFLTFYSDYDLDYFEKELVEEVDD